jgi:hypothetical protein
MAKVCFPFRVKHKGRFYASCEPFEVSETEVDKLVKLGAKVVQKDSQPTESARKETSTATKHTAKKKPYKIPTPEKKG